MKIIASVLAAAFLGFAALGAEPARDDLPRGRVCISVVEPGTPEHEVVFNAAILPGPGKKIRIYADASIKRSVVVVAMRKDGKLAGGWQPQIAELPEEFEEAQLPSPPTAWNWTSPVPPFDFHILFLPPGSKELETLKKLVAAMRNPKADERLVAMQTNKLREIISGISGSLEQGNRVTAIAVEVGGVFRGSAFPWRQYARSVSFSADRAGVLVLSSAKDEAPKAAASAPQ